MHAHPLTPCLRSRGHGSATRRLGRGFAPILAGTLLGFASLSVATTPAPAPPPVATLHAADPREEIAPLRPFRYITRQHDPGLPQSTVASLMLDRNGVLWLGTLDGVASFDGRAVVDHGAIAGTPGLGAVMALAPRWNGGFYAGGTHGLYAREPDGTWQSFGGGDAILSAAETVPGIVYVVDQRGRLRRMSDEGPALWSNIPLPDTAGRPLRVVSGADGVVWALTRSALLRLDAAGLVATSIAADPTASYAELALDTRGTIWVGDSTGRLWFTTPSTNASGLHPGPHACSPGIAVTALTTDWRDRVWAGCADGSVSVGVGQGPREGWHAPQGLSRSARIVALFVDRHGSVWIGRNGSGAMQLISEQWQHRNHWLGTERNIEGEPVFGITATADGGFLAAVFNHGIWRWDGHRMTQIGIEHGLRENARSAVEPQPGVLWVGGRFGVYESRRGGPFVRVLALPMGFVTGFRRGPGGTWYALTSVEGLWSYRAGAWAPEHAINEQLPHLNVRDAKWMRDGALWLATGAGVAVVGRDGVVTPLHGAGEPGLQLVNTILERENGDVWVGTLGGLWIHEGTTWHKQTAADGVPGRTIYSLAHGEHGSIWAGGSNGVGHWSAGQWRRYSRDDGLLDDECTLDGLLVRPGGQVLVGTMASLAAFSPSEIAPPAPRLDIVWHALPYPFVDGVRRLPRGQRRLTLAWSAAWLTGTRVEFRTRLLPGTGEYSAPTQRNEAELSRLGPGTWTFEVQARLSGSGEGGWTETRAVHVAVVPYFYETWWAKSVVGFLLLAAIPVGFRLWTAQLRRRQRRLQEAVDTAVAQVKTLTGLIPICASCKRIRDDHGAWNQLEAYLRAHSDATLSHGICPECMNRLYPEFTGGVLPFEAESDEDSTSER